MRGPSGGRAEQVDHHSGRMILLDWRISIMHVDVILSRIVGYEWPAITSRFILLVD